MLTTRELPFAEWHKLVAFEPFASSGLPGSDENWKIGVVEVDGEIVGHVSAHGEVHLDPWDILPAHRGNPGVVRALVRQAFDILAAAGVPYVFCTIEDERILSQDLAARLGFTPAPGQLYLLVIPKE